MVTKQSRSERGAIGVGLIVTLAIVGALVVGGLAGYGFANSTRSEAIQREQQLTAQYLSNQNFLSTYISTFYEQLGVANLKSEKMNAIIMDAVKGRYDKDDLQSGSLAMIIAEAYPDVKSLDIYDKILPTIAAGREGYRNLQDKLLDQLRSYDTWRKDGIIRNMVLQNFIPSENLEARVGTKVVTGKEAREKMYLIVLASDAVKAYDTGTLEPLDPNKK